MEQKVMATITAPTPTPPSRHLDRPLWQAPVFVLGALALLAVWFSRPLFPENLERRLDRQLGNVRQLLARADGDLEQAHRLADRAARLADQVGDRQGEAALLLGTVHIRLAEH